MYRSLEATLHDPFWDAEGDSAELPLIRDFLARHRGPVIDLGCGSGRFLLPLLTDGIDIEGIDCSPDMLALCRQYAAVNDQSPVLHLGDMQSVRLPRTYQAALIPAFTLQILPNPSLALSNIHRHLAPGGGLYLSTFIPHAELSGELPADTWYLDHESFLPGDRTASIHTRHRIQPVIRFLVRQHHYEIRQPDGSLEESHQSTQHLRWYHPDELCHLLADHGFHVNHRLANLDPGDHDPTPDSDIITLAATRR
jgi:SAM-dependent methyltransferase